MTFGDALAWAGGMCGALAGWMVAAIPQEERVLYAAVWVAAMGLLWLGVRRMIAANHNAEQTDRETIKRLTNELAREVQRGNALEQRLMTLEWQMKEQK
jgi:uncharacterized membrane protein (Fun14 family)